MMTSPQFRTLAYKTGSERSRRTTFQDELQAAVSARARKTKKDPYFYSDDFNEDDDEFLNQLLKSREKKSGVYKARKSKAKISNFELSDDEDKQGETKKVSFLKTKRIHSPSGDSKASYSQEKELLHSSISGHNDNNSFSSQHSTNLSEDDTEFKNNLVDSVDPQNTRENSRKSQSYETSDDTLLDMSLPLPSDSSVVETSGPEEKSNTIMEESSLTPYLSESDFKHVLAAGAAEREPPRPKPRQRTLGLSLHTAEKPAEETESQDVSRPQTSSTSIPLSTDASSSTAMKSCSPQWTDRDHTVSFSLSTSSTYKREQSQLLSKSTVDSGSRDDFVSDDSKEHRGLYSTSFEEFHEDSGDHLDHSVTQLSNTQEKSFDTSRTSSSHSKTTRRSQSACSRKVESKYLGTLKFLDRKVSLQDSQPQAADSVRAAIYQEWLKKKKEKSRENMQLKKKEEMLKEQKKKEEEAKKEDAIASYEAWKEKKAENLKAKSKEKQEMTKREQRATEEKEEKRKSAKQVFEKWRHEHDHLVKEKLRKQAETENKRKLEKQEQEEERKRESKSAFSNWCEKKKDDLHEKGIKERKEVKTKAEEEQYMKEERDKMALEMYENWLARKELEQKRKREERRIKAILRDSPPPPWSPPNKTIPFGK
ncbi:microtubule-associated protein 9 isoform X2 [Echeneis naucrates]|uniref:microtubule-associated protein 9 isoform X2 n=1 Tax=Echeneis naucrates TaxID=173247 RepID=UPI001113E186|nr:microtubule-associated protein 9 isoform X2 [Echeneis naucrates]